MRSLEKARATKRRKAKDETFIDRAMLTHQQPNTSKRSTGKIQTSTTTTTQQANRQEEGGATTTGRREKAMG